MLPVLTHRFLSKEYKVIDVAQVSLSCTIAPLPLETNSISSAQIISSIIPANSYESIQISPATFRISPKTASSQYVLVLDDYSKKINNIYILAKRISEREYCAEQKMGFGPLFAKPDSIATVKTIPSVISATHNYIAYIIFLPASLLFFFIVLDFRLANLRE
jgi:hypothetical protein